MKRKPTIKELQTFASTTPFEMETLKILVSAMQESTISFISFIDGLKDSKYQRVIIQSEQKEQRYQSKVRKFMKQMEGRK